MSTYNLQVTFFLETCPSCGIVFAITNDYRQRLLETGEVFFCPTGHRQNYSKPIIPRLNNEIANLKSQLEAAKRQVASRDETISRFSKDKERLHRKLKKLQPTKPKKSKRGQV